MILGKMYLNKCFSGKKNEIQDSNQKAQAIFENKHISLCLPLNSDKSTKSTTTVCFTNYSNSEKIQVLYFEIREEVSLVPCI